MPITATLTLNVTAFGSDEFLPTTLISVALAASPLQNLPQYPFATGFQSISVPTGSTYMIISNITGTLTIKGISGDTGKTISPGPAVLPVSVAVGITASAGAICDILFI